MQDDSTIAQIRLEWQMLVCKSKMFIIQIHIVGSSLFGHSTEESYLFFDLPKTVNGRKQMISTKGDQFS